jgi:adenylate cyclase
MPQEIERKFLVVGDAWRQLDLGKRYCQGYIPTLGKQTVRARIAGEKGYLTLKGPTVGITRPEFEYEIPLQEAQAILETLCDKPLIDKIRYRICIDEVVWEVDEFLGENAGLILAEIELLSEAQSFSRPDWLGAEVTGDARYYNSALAKHPFQAWC